MRDQAVRDLMNTDVLVMSATLLKFVQLRSSDVPDIDWILIGGVFTRSRRERRILFVKKQAPFQIAAEN
jgi:hypothetical protein